MSYIKIKSVHVNRYPRFRLGKWRMSANIGAHTLVNLTCFK